MIELLLAALAAHATNNVPKAAPVCEPLSGMDEVLKSPGINFLLFGEYHGTKEMPAVAGQAICSAVQSGRPVVLGIEFAPENQKYLEAFLGSDGGRDAVQALLAAPAWSEGGGRTTQAIVDLLESARRLRKHERGVTVVAFDKIPTPILSKQREAGMAEALVEAQKRVAGSLVIALTGAGHAGKTAWSSQNPPFPSTGQLLPQGRSLSFSFARPGGWFWGCQPANGGARDGCKAQQMPAREPITPKAIRLDGSVREGFDGTFSAGRTYQASEPARR